MSDDVGRNTGCSSEPQSSSQDVHQQHHESEQNKPPEYSQQPIEGIDMPAQVIAGWLGSVVVRASN